jgi:hypothetical protein
MVNCLDKATRMSDSKTIIYQQAKSLIDDAKNLVRKLHGTDMETYIKAQEQFQFWGNTYGKA